MKTETTEKRAGPIKFGDFDTFTRAYIECALWSSHDESDDSGGDAMDANYSPDDLTQEALKSIAADCEAFQKDNEESLTLAFLDASRAGFCFWLNRNGHGSGFWDEYSQTTCDLYEREQAIAVISRDFSKREALTCPCPYHACQRLSAASKIYGSVDLYVTDDGQVSL